MNTIIDGGLRRVLRRRFEVVPVPGLGERVPRSWENSAS